MIGDGYFVSQPVTYSDKKKFLNYVVDLRKIYGSRTNLYQIPVNRHLTLIKSTQGRYYQELFKKICNDYRQLFDINGTDNEVFFKANSLMKTMSE